MLMMRSTQTSNVVEYSPFTLVQRKRSISISPGAKWDNSLSTGGEYVIPAGTPMAPITAGTGLYKPIRRTTIATVATANETVATMAAVSEAKKFAVGDVVNI